MYFWRGVEFTVYKTYRWERNRAAEGNIFIYSTSSRHSRKQQRMPRVSSRLGRRVGCLGQGRVCCAGAGGGRGSKGARPSHRPPSTTSGDTGAASPGAASPGAASLTCCPPCLASPGTAAPPGAPPEPPPPGRTVRVSGQGEEEAAPRGKESRNVRH